MSVSPRKLCNACSKTAKHPDGKDEAHGGLNTNTLNQLSPQVRKASTRKEKIAVLKKSGDCQEACSMVKKGKRKGKKGKKSVRKTSRKTSHKKSSHKKSSQKKSSHKKSSRKVSRRRSRK